MMMKTRNVLFNFFFALLMILPFPCYVFCAQSVVTGEITSSIILQERIYLNTGDKAVTNLGSKDGVIKGDILIVTTRLDVMKEKPIGQCAVTSVDVKSSICEIITSNMEIPQGSNVSIPVMYYYNGAVLSCNLQNS